MEKKKVENVSLEMYEDDGELFGDNGHEVEEAYSVNQVEFIKKGLTRKQQRILDLLVSGYSRKEIAQEQGICLQAVNQIIPRIRKRMKAMPYVMQGLKKRIHDFNY